MGTRRIWPARGGRGERRIRGLDAQGNRTAHELQSAIAQQRAGKQAALHQNLESVADAQHQSAVGREFLHCAHHRRKFGDGAATKIVAVGEAAGQDHRVDVAQRGRVVPDQLARLAEVMGNRVPSVVIAIAAGKNDDAESHGEKFKFSKRACPQRRGNGATGVSPAGPEPGLAVLRAQEEVHTVE